jgi:hypothetical protein
LRVGQLWWREHKSHPDRPLASSPTTCMKIELLVAWTADFLTEHLWFAAGYYDSNDKPNGVLRTAGMLRSSRVSA